MPNNLKFTGVNFLQVREGFVTVYLEAYEDYW